MHWHVRGLLPPKPHRGFDNATAGRNLGAPTGDVAPHARWPQAAGSSGQVAHHDTAPVRMALRCTYLPVRRKAVKSVLVLHAMSGV
jgi:hypothetical protein